MERVNIGLLGCGGVAHRWYLKGLTPEISKDYSLVAVADIDIKKAKETADAYKIGSYYGSIEELCNHPGLNMVVVLTRHKDHYEHIKYCIESGLHVYSEKPFAETSEQAAELIELASQKNVVLGAAPQIMLSSRNKRIKEMVDSGILGKVTFVRASNSNMGPADRAGIDFDPRWFYQDGGSIKSLGIYTLSTLLWIFGKPKRIAGFSGISIPKRKVMYGKYEGNEFDVTVPDNEACIMEFDGNMYALFDGSYSVLNPPEYEFEIHGTAASLFVGGYGGMGSVIIQKRGCKKEEVGPDDDCHLKWNLSWGVEETVDAIIKKHAPKTDPQLALMVIKAIEAIQRSSREGRYMSID